MAFDREAMTPALARLAREGVFLGTSSWKYPGWFGQLYDRGRYVWRGRYAESRFNRQCLAEYAEVFKTVCVDAAYYRFPTARQLAELAGQVPPDFLFAFKVTDEITIKRFARLDRFGDRAGKANENFLNADLFSSSFLGPCENIRRNVGLIIFEFSRFYPSDFADSDGFIEALEGFLAALPGGWPYGVEIRNRELLRPDYFAMLARHSVAHIFNSWTDMPAVTEQQDLPGSRSRADLLGARLLLRPGRRYEQAVAEFSPYREVKDAYPEGRAGAVRLVQTARASGGRTRALIFVNNRFEGNALETIGAVVEAVQG
jgi:uncharacterized protein YecE (DUF72 family)